MRKKRKESREKRAVSPSSFVKKGEERSSLSRFTKKKESSLQSKLLLWYQENKRDLPWRKTKDPYRIWLSEIMLQQTQVKTVIDYYHRFLTRFPTLLDLANAKEEEVLTLWSGLGYYSRARNLHQAAQRIVRDYDAVFPSEPFQILSLPGIGRYTLGAIASIAFGQPLPLVDGNVIRVYSRIFAVKGNPKDSSFQKKIWQIAEANLIKENPGDFNQALMELGATVCLPQNPLCLLCPVREACKATVLGAEKFPEKKERPKTKKLLRLVAILEREKKIFLTFNEKDRWQKGLWQLPGIILENRSDLEAQIKSYLKEKKVRFHSLHPLPTHTHSITHHRITVYPYLTRIDQSPKIGERSQWVELSQLDKIGLPATDRKILESLKI